jgi:cholesterol transport system auxiliary component
VSLLPKADPSQLYRFGAEGPQVQVASGTRFGVLKLPTSFVRASASDRILTVTGGEAAFVKEARWVSPAAVLFDEAVNRTFQTPGGRARLITRGEVAQADYTLKLDVRSFEARYRGGPKAPPEVVVDVRATLTRSGDRALVGEKVFAATIQASNNRMGAIVPAFDQATDQVVGELYAWVNSAG